jgi:SNF2 family DNA or RNA helicase
LKKGKVAQKSAFHNVQDILEGKKATSGHPAVAGIMLRLTRSYILGGETPDIVEHLHEIAFTPHEQAFYEVLLKRTKASFQAAKLAEKKKYPQIVKLILRLRQASAHPNLVTEYAENMADKCQLEDIAQAELVLNLLTSVVVPRLRAADP